MAPTVLFIRHVLIAIALVALALLLWQIAYALLLAFGGLLFAVLLRGAAQGVQRWTNVAVPWALAAVGLGIIGLLAAIVTLAGPQVAEQTSELAQALPSGLARIQEFLRGTPWGRHLLDFATQGMQQGGDLLGMVRHVVIGGFDAAIGLVLILFAGIYFAATPRVYSEGLVLLFPRSRHARVREALEAAHRALWLWLVGQVVLMLLMGVLSAIGLYIIGVPLALVLGLIVALLEFIPFLGPIVASVPMLLVALTAGADKALYALVFFLALQQLENHLLVPLVQRWAVELPPVLILVAAIGFALVFGMLGAIFATPLLVVAVVWTKMLYMQDVLGERVHVQGAA